LNVDTALVQLGQKKFQFAITDERVSANEGEMERAIAVYDLEDALDESVSFEIG
jgi:hypothetical protein